MKIGLGIGVTQPQNMPMASVGSPSYLFRDGAQGTWYDPSDINLAWRRNLLTYSEQFDNAAWIKTASSITSNAAVAPDGTLTANKLVETVSGVSSHDVRVSGTQTSPYTVSVYAKASERSWIKLSSGIAVVFFNVAAGTVGSYSGTGASGAAIQPVGNGWYRCSVLLPAITSSVMFLVGTAVADGALNHAGDGTSGIYIWGAQLELGSTATPYQRITDGVQDYLQYQAQPVLYQDAAGTTPVTGVEQPVGLMLDKSKGLVLGPELISTPLNFTDSAAWTSAATSVTQNTFTIGSAGGVFTAANKTVSGKSYRLQLIWSATASVTMEIRNGNSSGSPLVSSQTGTSGTLNCVLPSAATAQVYLRGVGGATYTITSLSVRELPGNHAFNSSGNSANFPVLSARYNLLTKTEDFLVGAWNTTAAFTSITGGFTDPLGGSKAFKLVGASKNIYQVGTGVPTGSSMLFVVAFRGDTAGTVLVSNANGGAVTTTINVTTDWKYFTVPLTATGTGDGPAIFTTGTLSTIYVAFPDLRVTNDGMNLPAYQRVNTATDYDTVGFKPYLKFNGTNQWLQTNSIDLTYGDKMFVSAGVRKLSDAANGLVSELSADATSNSGAFNLFAPVQTQTFAYRFRNNGTAFAEAGVALASYPAPTTNIISGIGNISGDQSILRVNGTQAAISTSDQGTGNYGNYPLYIGARGGTSLWFNGRLYGMVVAGKQVSAVEIDKTEDYIALKTAFTYPSISGVPTFMVVL